MMKSPQSYLMKWIRGSCYVFSLCKAAEMYLEETGNPEKYSMIDHLTVALRSKHIAENAYVKDAEAFLNENFPQENAKWVVKHTKKPIDHAINIEHWRWNQKHHFRIRSWDPMEYPTEAERNGEVVDYRAVYLHPLTG